MRFHFITSFAVAILFLGYRILQCVLCSKISTKGNLTLIQTFAFEKKPFMISKGHLQRECIQQKMESFLFKGTLLKGTEMFCTFESSTYTFITRGKIKSSCSRRPGGRISRTRAGTSLSGRGTSKVRMRGMARLSQSSFNSSFLSKVLITSFAGSESKRENGNPERYKSYITGS